MIDKMMDVFGYYCVKSTWQIDKMTLSNPTLPLHSTGKAVPEETSHFLQKMAAH